MKKFCILIISYAIAILGYSDINCNQGDQDPIPPNPTPHPGPGYDPAGSLSYDPNEIIGPTGVDSVRWVSVNDVLNYTILFENDPEFATAAAQRVDVRFDFQDKALQKGFGIGTYSFSNMSFAVDNEPNVYQNRINLRDSLGIYVDVIGGLDVTKNQAFWTFSTIDPETGYAPWEHDKGVLQVNDSTHVGEGFVTFVLRPLNTMQTGDTISIQANIVFDENDTIPTNRWCNMIDAGMPTSKVSGSQTDAEIFSLSFSAEDDEGGSGVKSVSLYLANNSGTYEEYGTYSPDSIVTFAIEQGKQYKIFSLATDMVGNMEPLKSEPDIIINFNQAPTDITLSNDTFDDDLEIGSFIGELKAVDSDEDETTFVYEMAEGEGAIHNDMFTIDGSQLKVNDCLKCAEDSVFNIRVSTTDGGGLSFSKAFTLHLNHVLERPETTYINAEICEGDFYDFFGEELESAGEFRYSKPNNYMCDSLFVLNLRVKPIPEAPTVTIENGRTLVSSVENGNIWFKDDEIIEGVDSNMFTPTESGVYYVTQSNGTCYSSPSDKFIVNMDNTVDYNLELSEGWSWISSNLADEEMQDPQNLLASVSASVERLVGTTSELVQDPEYGLVGNLNAISPLASYRIKMSKSENLNVKGTFCIPDEVPLTINKGWNWIGYLPIEDMSLTDALSNLKPTENDMIKSQSGFAVYTNGKWEGTLSVMKKAEGFMYYSNGDASFCYPYSRITKVVDSSQNTPAYAPMSASKWTVDTHAYPDNMTIIAQINSNDALAPVGTFSIGAFVGKECRGIGDYVNDRLFITVHGSTFDDNVTFKAIENATGNECTVTETVKFGADRVGSYPTPFILHVNGASGINDAYTSSFGIYPNPVRENLYVSGNTDAIIGIRIISMSGALVITEDFYNADRGVDVTRLAEGYYICGIVTEDGIVYKQFIKD